MPDDFERRLRDTLRAYRPRRIEPGDAREAAVLIPVVGRPEPGLLLTVRTDTLSSHRGQISFPGGSKDPEDESDEATALREASEELGLDVSNVRIAGRLDTIATVVSGFVVTPVVGFIDDPPELEPNPAEVARVLVVPIGRLTDEIRAEPGFSHAGRTYPTEAWIHEDAVIWGVTARILRLFLERLADAGLADPPAPATWPWPSPAPAS
jgi:8-oxo-dGTP pyrophosphatase MutT (NUDIX family)